MKKFFLAILCLVAASSTAVAQQSALPAPANPAAHESTTKVRQKTFEKVWMITRDKFFDPNFNGVDWNKVHERYAPQVAAVKTDAELYDLLNRMVGELKFSHMEIVTPDVIKALGAPPVTTGLGLRNVEGRLVVMRVLPGSSASREGLRPGFVVQRIDGEEVTDLQLALGKLHGDPHTKVRLSYLDERDATREVTLERMPLGAGEVDRDKFGSIPLYALFESRRLEAGIGYIRFTSFIPSLNEKIRQAVESLHDAPGLVIDLRGNGGGDDEVAIRLAGLLFDKPTQLMITRTRKGDTNYYRARPAKNPYTGMVVILMDEGSGSASEQFAAGMQEAGRAYVVGKKSGGDDMDADIVELPTGAYFIYAAGEPRTPKGVIVEGRGVIPDLEVNLTRAGLLRGDDAQLGAAIQYITQKMSKGTH
ncbi:MAG: carboxyl-terminal processing protease [Acidobacteriota bacterium]|jgi:carboxyl-terminal processing protease|nr:carboxyl-terminal processing protease [Acidobacteriota bacterium]